MKIGFYQHGSVASKVVAAAVASCGVKVALRNAFYFNERETEKFDVVVVDEGKNSGAVTAAYTGVNVPVWTEAEFLEAVEKGSLNPAKPKKAEAPALTAAVASAKPEQTPAPAKGDGPKDGFNPDAPRRAAKPGKKQGATPAPAKGE